MRLIFCSTILLLLFYYPISSLGQNNISTTSGETVLNVENNWAFGARTTNLLPGSVITLEWTSDDRTTGWLTCNENNQIANTILSDQIGNLTLITEQEKTCGIAIYRIDKPGDNHSISVMYSYSWIPSSSTSDDVDYKHSLFFTLFVLVSITKINGKHTSQL